MGAEADLPGGAAADMLGVMPKPGAGRGWLAALIALAALRAGAFAAYAACMLPLPLEAFHLESKMVHHAWRVQQGLPLYPPWEHLPYIPNFFAPLYFLAVGGIGRAAGAGVDGLSWIGRGATFAMAAAVSLGLGIWLGRRFGRGAGWLAGLASFGALPMEGFAVMVRPDAAAEALGALGIVLVAFAGRRWVVVLGVVALAAAALTKQTAGLATLAAAAALVAVGRRRAGLGVVAGVAALVGMAVGLATLAAEPGMPRSLLGEGAAPWSASHGLATIGRLLAWAPDLVAWPLLALGRQLRDREGWGRPAAAISAVMLAGSAALAFKVGSDQNYFLGLRLGEALAAVALAGVLRDAARPRWRRRVLGLVLAGTLAPGVVHAADAARSARALAQAAPAIRAAYRPLAAMAGSSRVRMLTDSGWLAVRQGERAPFVDPWLFRIMVESGRIDPAELREEIEREEFDHLVLTSELFSDVYPRYEFGLPETLWVAAREHYVLVGSHAGMFLYRPRSRPEGRGGSP